MTQQATRTVNGVHVNQLVETIDAVKANPELAKCRFRAATEWINGARSRTKIKSFYAAGQEDTTRSQPFQLEGDEPPVLLGENRAPNAVETLLHALTSCLAVGFAYNAAAQGIRVDSLTFNVEGKLDLRAFLGIAQQPRPGYQNIQLTYQVQSDAPREKIVELCNYVQETSPVLDVIRNATPVSVTLEG